jgi:outer membrane protein
MKKNLILSLLTASLVFGHHASAELNIGTVDMKKVFESYKKTKDAEQRISEMRNKYKKELDERMEKLKGMKDDIDKLTEETKKTELSQEKRVEKARKRDEIANEANNLWKDVQQSQQEKEKQLADHSVRMRNGIVDEIKKVIDKAVATKGYDLVFDKSGPSLNGVNIVLHSKDTWDFTKDVIDELNKAPGASTADDLDKAPEKAPAATPATPAKPAAKKDK